MVLKSITFKLGKYITNKLKQNKNDNKTKEKLWKNSLVCRFGKKKTFYFFSLQCSLT